MADKHILNVNSGYSAPITVHCSYGDSGKVVTLYVYDGDKEFSFSGAVVSVHGTRKDRANFGPFGCSYSGNAVSFVIQPSMTSVEGAAVAELTISKSGTTIGTCNFGILVEKAVFPNGVSYDTDPSVYQDILNYVQSLPSSLKGDYIQRINQETQARIAGDNANAMAIETQKARIDNLIAPTTVEGELVDIRTGYDSITYSSAGTAVRTQVADLYNRCDGVEEDIDAIKDSLMLVNNYNKFDYAKSVAAALMADGTINTSYSNLRASDYIEVKKGDTIYLTAISSTDTYVYGTQIIARIVMYDENKTRLANADYVNNYLIETDNTAYIRFSYNTSGTLGTAKIVSLTVNSLPATVSEIEPYNDPEYGNAYLLALEANEKVDSIVTTVESTNKLDPSKVVVGNLRTSDGLIETTSTDFKVSGYIEVKNGDTVYLTAIGANDDYIWNTGIIQRLCFYDKNKSFISSATGTNDYTVDISNVKYLRFSWYTAGALGTAKVISLSINYKPADVAAIDEYFPTYYTSDVSEAIEKADQALAAVGNRLNEKIIDCWGDSLTAMIATSSTSYCDYLQSKLGSNYIVANYGVSSQASGMCAARFGSNEFFVTFENNVINASGNSNITDIKVSSGIINNFFCYSDTVGVICSINGITGRIYKTSPTNYNTCVFVRDVDGSQVTVYPRTKAYVIGSGDKNHACIFWWGKNDLGTGAEGRAKLKAVCDDAVKFLSHDRYIILGVTCSVSSDYESGQTLRTFVDNYNQEMLSAYPNNFIDINAWLASTAALSSVGLTPTAQDTEYIAKGWPAYQLMVYSTDTTDPTHLNAYGRQAVANKIFNWMGSHDWI